MELAVYFSKIAECNNPTPKADDSVEVWRELRIEATESRVTVESDVRGKKLDQSDCYPGSLVFVLNSENGEVYDTKSIPVVLGCPNLEPGDPKIEFDSSKVNKVIEATVGDENPFAKFDLESLDVVAAASCPNPKLISCMLCTFEDEETLKSFATSKVSVMIVSRGSLAFAR